MKSETVARDLNKSPYTQERDKTFMEIVLFVTLPMEAKATIADHFSICLFTDTYTTGSTNINLLYLPDSIEIASLEGLTLWCPENNQSKQLLA